MLARAAVTYQVFRERRQRQLPLACHLLLKGTRLKLGKSRISTDRLNRVDSKSVASFVDERTALYLPERPFHTHASNQVLGGRRASITCSNEEEVLQFPVAPVVQLVTSKPSDVGT